MLKDWLKRSRQTQAQLAEQVGTTPMTIWRLANGQQTASLELAVKLEEITGIPPREFLKREGAEQQ